MIYEFPVPGSPFKFWLHRLQPPTSAPVMQDICWQDLQEPGSPVVHGGACAGFGLSQQWWLQCLCLFRQGVLPAGSSEWMWWRMGTVGTACSLLCFTGYRCPFPDRERVKQAQLHIPTAVPAWFLSDRTQRSLITHLYEISNSLYGHKKRGRIFLSTEPWLGELYLPQVQISPLWALDSCKRGFGVDSLGQQ